MSGAKKESNKESNIVIFVILVSVLLAFWYKPFDYETFIVGQSYDDNDDSYYLRCQMEEGRKILRILKPDLPGNYENLLCSEELERENNLALNQIALDLMSQLGFSKNPPTYSYLFEKDLNRGKIVVVEALVETWLRGKEKRELKKGELAEVMAKIKID